MAGGVLSRINLYQLMCKHTYSHIVCSSQESRGEDQETLEPSWKTETDETMSG